MLAIAEALDIIYETIERQKPVSNLLAERLHKYSDKNIRARINFYVKEYLRRHLLCEALRQKFSKKNPKKYLRYLLNLGVFLLLFTDSENSYGYYVDALVNIAKARWSQYQANFVNAVLRNVLNNKQHILKEVEDMDHHIKLSVPDEWWKYFVEVYGIESAYSMLQNMNRAPRYDFFYVLGTPDEALKRLYALIPAENIQYIKAGNYIKIRSVAQLAEVPFESMGLIKMDLPFIYAVNIVKHYSNGGRFLDAYSGIGNKLWSVRRYFSEAIAVDRIPAKLRLARKRGIMLNLPAAKFVCAEWNGIGANFLRQQEFDFILADVPCTGLGSLSRKPDIRYHTTPKTAQRLADIVFGQLAEISNLLKKDAFLMFVTCTLTREENEMQVQNLMDKLNFKLIDLCDFADMPFIEHNKFLKFLPLQENQAGGFIALMRKV